MTMPTPVNVLDFQAAKTYVTTVDDCVLLRLVTSNLEQPEMWLRLHREDFIDFAAFLTHDAEQLKAKQ